MKVMKVKVINHAVSKTTNCDSSSRQCQSGLNDNIQRPVRLSK